MERADRLVERRLRQRTSRLDRDQQRPGRPSTNAHASQRPAASPKPAPFSVTLRQRTCKRADRLGPPRRHVRIGHLAWPRCARAPGPRSGSSVRLTRHHREPASLRIENAMFDIGCRHRCTSDKTATTLHDRKADPSPGHAGRSFGESRHDRQFDAISSGSNTGPIDSPFDHGASRRRWRRTS